MAPSLFGPCDRKRHGPSHQCLVGVLALPLRFVIYADFLAVLDVGDRTYFRSTRERTLGMSLEAACADQQGN